MTRDDMVLINKIASSYPEKRDVFDSLDLALSGGNIYGLLGKNGAGKSTLLKLTAGLAKNQGAEVTAVCSTDKGDLAEVLEAAHVIDYTKKKFTRTGKKYDLILAANGNLRLSEYKRALFKTAQADLVYPRQQVEAGKLKPVIDKLYSIYEIDEAMDYLEVGHAKVKLC